MSSVIAEQQRGFFPRDICCVCHRFHIKFISRGWAGKVQQPPALGCSAFSLLFPDAVSSLLCFGFGFFPPLLLWHPCSPSNRSRLGNVEYSKVYLISASSHNLDLSISGAEASLLWLRKGERNYFILVFKNYYLFLPLKKWISLTSGSLAVISVSTGLDSWIKTLVAAFILQYYNMHFTPQPLLSCQWAKCCGKSLHQEGIRGHCEIFLGVIRYSGSFLKSCICDVQTSHC